ncbi:MAG: acyltransferase family protein [Clostridia bacterium]|nr:acyltransferase family protein [Clostridia bacterium]
MILLYVILLGICLWGIRLRKVENEISRSYLSKTQTKSIQGVFVIIVLFSHFSSYVSMEYRFDEWFVYINNKIGQLMVTMFLFYSGYGIMESIKKKRESYINGFLTHRMLPVYSRFFLSVILFIIVDASLGLLGKEYSLVDCLLAFTAWTSIGNSTWFMFCTFVLYIFVFISFRWMKNKDMKIPLCILTALTILYIIVFSLFIQKGIWWYNTILCFPFGMWFSYYLEKIDKIYKSNRYYFGTLSIVLILFLGFYLLQDKIPYGYGYCLLALAFTMLILLFTMKVMVGNILLDFFGTHIFSIYILQRLTYIIFQKFISNVYLFFVVCFTLTIIIAVVFDYAYNRLYKKIIRKIQHINV